MYLNTVNIGTAVRSDSTMSIQYNGSCVWGLMVGGCNAILEAIVLLGIRCSMNLSEESLYMETLCSRGDAVNAFVCFICCCRLGWCYS